MAEREEILNEEMDIGRATLHIRQWFSGTISLQQVLKERAPHAIEYLRIDLDVKAAKELGRRLIELASESSEQPDPVQTGEDI